MTSEGSYYKPKILNVFEVDRETEVTVKVILILCDTEDCPPVT